MKRFLRDNGLTAALLLLTAASLIGHFLSGYAVLRDDELRHGRSFATTRWEYFASGHFLESLFENWESEFLQMAAYVLLTAALFQRGSAESKDPDDTDADPDPAHHQAHRHAPWPVRKGGIALRLYSHSLSLALFALFLLSLAMHALNGARLHDDELVAHGELPAGLRSYMASAQFWFESFQNWQSEFLSVATLVVLSIFLREIGSPESKPVHAAHAQTGKD